MFSSADWHARSSLVCLTLLAASAVLAPRGRAQESSKHPAGPANPSELRVFDSSLIDKSIDPCENFYRFSCNGWFKRNPLPPDQTAYGRFTELHELNRLHLRQILESAAAAHPDSRSPNEQKIGDYYASCTDAATINNLGLKPLQSDLDRIASLKSVNELPVLLGRLHRIGVNAFFGVGSGQDFADAIHVFTFYCAGGLGLP